MLFSSYRVVLGYFSFPGSTLHVHRTLHRYVRISTCCTVLSFIFSSVRCTVVDEFFVPALETIAVQIQVSNDVAGATLMAAGGSAPELFTSFIGTMQDSDIGFAAIVG